MILIGSILYNPINLNNDEKGEYDALVKHLKNELKISKGLELKRGLCVIKQEIEDVQNENVSRILPLEVLVEECKFNDELKTLVDHLKKNCNIFYIRRIRGDGNCYYRSVGYAYFELVIKSGIKHVECLLKSYFLYNLID